MSSHIPNVRPQPDQVLLDIADYVMSYKVASELAYETARNCLIDTLGCGLEALEYPACTKLLGPLVHGTVVPNGAKVPGTQFQLDPVQAAFNIGAMIRWLDFNDAWLAAEWGHPSDNLGGILSAADWLSRNAIAAGKEPLPMREVLTAMIKAHEIQGCLALENAFNKVGLDHVVLVSKLKEVVVEYPIGHRRRRAEGIPLLVEKFKANLARRFPKKQQDAILAVSLDQKALEAMPVHEYVDMYVI